MLHRYCYTCFPVCLAYKTSDTIACTVHIFSVLGLHMHIKRALLFCSVKDFTAFLNSVVRTIAFLCQIDSQLKCSIALRDFSLTIELNPSDHRHIMKHGTQMPIFYSFSTCNYYTIFLFSLAKLFGRIL